MSRSPITRTTAAGPERARRERFALLVALVGVLATCACAATAERRIGRAFDDARTALRAGDLPEADTLAARGLELATSQPNGQWTWTFRLLRTEIALTHGESTGLPGLTDALPNEPGFDALRARQKYLMALGLRNQGRMADARAALEDARRSAPQNAGELRLDIDALDGQLALRQGRASEGEATLNRVVAAAAAHDDPFHRAVASNDLGMGRFVKHRYDEALPWFESVLSSAGLEDLTVYRKALTNAGMCYSRLGQFERAAAVQRRAVDLYERKPAGPEYEQALGQLGITYRLQGDAEGLRLLQRAFETANTVHVTSDATLWAGNLSTAFAELHQWDEADRYNDEAKRLWERTHSGRPIYNTLNSAAIAAGRRQYPEATRLYDEVLSTADAPPSVMWDAHASLANIATTLNQPAVAARHFEAALGVIEKTRSDLLKTDYKISYLTQLISFYQQYVDALAAHGENDRALEIADSSRGQVLAQRQGTSAPPRSSAAVFRRLAKDSRAVFLSYWLTPAKSYLWVVTADGIHAVPLPPAKDIERLVREHESVIANAMADPLAIHDSAGDALYRLLVAPAARWIPAKASVVIVPDGALHGINFETLPVGGPVRHYWIDDAEIQVAPSLASLTMTTPPSAERSLLLIGNPTPRPPEFPALSFGPTEMASIAGHFGAERVTSFERERALPAAYRTAALDRFAFVHFTAHATANLESPLDSAVILSGPDSAYKLYARDVADRPLRAELVTVSACRSAGERVYSGEGLVGFAWAFLRAGARRVVAGLWDVDDRSTSELMDRLYARLAAGDPPRRALRDAKLALLHRGGHAAKPYYWAPFELFTVSP